MQFYAFLLRKLLVTKNRDPRWGPDDIKLKIQQGVQPSPPSTHTLPTIHNITTAKYLSAVKTLVLYYNDEEQKDSKW